MIENKNDRTLAGNVFKTGNFNMAKIESKREPHERDYDSPGHLLLVRQPWDRKVYSKTDDKVRMT